MSRTTRRSSPARVSFAPPPRLPPDGAFGGHPQGGDSVRVACQHVARGPAEPVEIRVDVISAVVMTDALTLDERRALAWARAATGTELISRSLRRAARGSLRTKNCAPRTRSDQSVARRHLTYQVEPEALSRTDGVYVRGRCEITPRRRIASTPISG